MATMHQHARNESRPSGLGFDTTTPFRVLEREHERLRLGLARLRSMLAEEATPLDELRAQIRAVRASLGIHFAFEENHGSLHHLMATRPDLQTRVSALRAEHLDILLTLDRAERRLAGGLSRAAVAEVLTALLERLTEHDLEQHRLVHRVLLEPALRRM